MLHYFKPILEDYLTGSQEPRDIKYLERHQHEQIAFSLCHLKKNTYPFNSVQFALNFCLS
jgi:hypothetical protein